MPTKHKFGIAAAIALAVSIGCAPSLTEEDRSQMWSAVSSNNFEKVQSLVEDDVRRANMVTSRKDNYTAVHHCVVYNKDDTRIVEYLLQNGADPNIASDTGWTPLHTAVWDANLGYVEVLLQYGADVSLKDHKKERSPLEMARRSGATSHIVEAMERHLQNQRLASQ